MVSKTEGIALLSMYNDEEEEEEEEEEEQQQHQEEEYGSKTQINEVTNDMMLLNSMAEMLPDEVPSKSPQNLSSPSPEVKALRSPTPPPWPKSQHSSPLNLASPLPALPPRPLPEPADGQRGRRGALVIVDYEHDEAAMSPEAEEGEIVSSGQIVVVMDIQPEGNFEIRTPPGTVQLLTPSTQTEPPQPADLAEQSRSETGMAIDSNGTEPEIAQAEIDARVSEEVQKDDPVKSFLPPPVTTKCPEELQYNGSLLTRMETIYYI